MVSRNSASNIVAQCVNEKELLGWYDVFQNKYADGLISTNGPFKRVTP